jgi:hypothetical protein
MTQIRATLAALAFGLAAQPVLAGGIPFDLPRLDFPAPSADTSRDCTAAPLTGAPATCTPAGN